MNDSQEKTLLDEPICLTDRLKAVLPNSPAARDALNLVELVLDSPMPPAKFAALSLLLGGLCPEPGEREATAEEWRGAASEVSALFAGQMPTSASWLNMVERFFRDISENRLRRGVFTSVPELVAAIDGYIAHHNTKPKPFIWTKSARDILQKVIRANSHLSSKQNATLH